MKKESIKPKKTPKKKKSTIKKTLPKKNGRPSKLDSSIVGKVVDVLKYDGTIEEACLCAGIHKDTYYQWIKEERMFADEIVVNNPDGTKKKVMVDKSFKLEVEQAQTFAKIIARKILINDVMKGNSKSALKFLERRDERYKQKVDVTEHIEPIDEDKFID